jgi:hypothetical protein
MAKVIVRIKNGIAESTEGIPTGMFIEVRNYDVANVAEDLLSKDADGQRYQVKEWHAPSGHQPLRVHLSSNACRLRRSTQHWPEAYPQEFGILRSFSVVDSRAARPGRAALL